LDLEDLVAPLDDELHALAGAVVADLLLELAARAHDAPVELEDEVVGAHARLVGRAPGDDALDVSRRRPREVRVEEADPALGLGRARLRGRGSGLGAALGPREERAERRHRHREADLRVRALALDEPAEDPEELAFARDERAALRARVVRRV